MKKIKIILSLLSLLLTSACGYSQQGYYVDKDPRIKKYQPEMVDFLTKNHQFGGTGPGNRKENFMSMFVYKTIELFPWCDKPDRPSILLVKFGSLADHGTDYWGLLEANSKLFFLNTEKPSNDLLNYMNAKKYSKEYQDIILNTLKLYKPSESSGGDMLLVEPK